MLTPKVLCISQVQNASEPKHGTNLEDFDQNEHIRVVEVDSII
jgi:hypothetical protein